MKKMTSRQRLMAAARRQPVDTIPISPRLGHACICHFGNDSYANNLRLKQIYDYDPFITIPGQSRPIHNPYETFAYAPGVNVDISVIDQGRKRVINRKIHTPDGQMNEKILVANPGYKEYGRHPNPTWTEHMVKSQNDLKKLRHLIPPVDASYACQYHGWEAVAGEEAVTRAFIYGPIDCQAGHAMSVENLMINYMIDRPFVVELVDMFWQQIMAQTKAILEQGVRFVFIPWFWHSLSVGWSPQIFKEWFLPMIKQQVELIHSYDAIANYYDDGKCMDILPFLVEAGVDIFETCTPPPVGDFDLAEAKKLYGDKITFMGYVDLIYTLQQGSVEDVKQQVKYACEVGGKGGGFILGTSDSMREGTPIENIDAYFKYAREFGKQ